MNKNVLILEDNEKTLISLKDAIKKLYGNRVEVYAVNNYAEACMIALSYHIDVFVLDIILSPSENGDTSGIYFAQELRNHVRYALTPIIFLTVLADPSNAALHQFHCFDYLEKPFPPEKLAETVGKALGFLETGNYISQLTMRKDGLLYVINPNDILYADVKQHVLSIHMKRETLSIPNRTLKQFMKQLNYKGFVQCSRHTAVNCIHIEHVDPVNKYITLKESKHCIEISRIYLKKILQGFSGTRLD